MRTAALDIAGVLPDAQIGMRRSAGHTLGAEADRRFLENNLVDWLKNAGIVQRPEVLATAESAADDDADFEVISI